MTSYAEKLDATIAPVRTAGALPSSRTNGQTEQALESQDVEVLSLELQHARSHYNSLELMVTDEDRIRALILEGLANGILPQPETLEETIDLVLRVFSISAVEAAYDAAHQTAFFIGLLGMSVEEAMQTVYGHRDFSDPEREDAVDQALSDILAEADAAGTDD